MHFVPPTTTRCCWVSLYPSGAAGSEHGGARAQPNEKQHQPESEPKPRPRLVETADARLGRVGQSARAEGLARLRDAREVLGVRRCMVVTAVRALLPIREAREANAALHTAALR